ncbi:MAG: hypothetical protein JXR56_03090, partial [Candidatus Cloacimonetes bacterium]|nr:hypothetical protein [Candidatus Cloacimonadota bacterium]
MEKPAIGNCAAQYSLCNNVSLPHSIIVRKWDTISEEHDLFSSKALGKSSKLIWEALKEGPKTIDELVKSTGRVDRTVRNRLAEMRKLDDG